MTYSNLFGSFVVECLVEMLPLISNSVESGLVYEHYSKCLNNDVGLLPLGGTTTYDANLNNNPYEMKCP